MSREDTDAFTLHGPLEAFEATRFERLAVASPADRALTARKGQVQEGFYSLYLCTSYLFCNVCSVPSLLCYCLQMTALFQLGQRCCQ